ncbi:MAG: GDP-fucose synthetase [Legionellales bacterium]|nr:GDP-fucose synthetase [Legionellales bacterium]
MKVLMTGSSGMVGRNTIAHKKARQFEIIAPSRQELDLTNFGLLNDFLLETKPDIIVHAAGKVGGIKANIADPYGFLLENLTLGLNILKAAKECGIGRLLNLASSCVYPRNAKNPIEETAILAGSLEPTNEGYALSKIMAIRFCAYISDQFRELNYKSIVPCNLYGPFDRFDQNNAHLVPAIINKIHDAVVSGNKTVKIWGDGFARREFMFAPDLGGLIWEACERFDSLPPIMNAGLGYDYTIKEYYEAVGSVIGFKGDFEFDLSQPVGMRQKLICTKKMTEWGWSPTTELKHGIAQTYEYYKGLEH